MYLPIFDKVRIFEVNDVHPIANINNVHNVV